VIDLVALDLDGTLIGDQMVIRDPVRRAIRRAQEQDVTVTLATGRMFDAALEFARDLAIDAPLICYQGGLIQAPNDQTPLFRATMDPAVVREALHWRTHEVDSDWHVVLYADNALFVAERRYPESFYRDLLGTNLRWVDDLGPVLEEHSPEKFLFIADPAEADRIETAMRKRFGEQFEVVRSHARLVEGNPQGVSKGDGLRRLAEHLGVDRERVMAVGDQGNDVPMIRWAGVGVAMGNGSPAAKAVADWIAPPFSEDGAAAAIERFVLEGRRSAF
jgi:hypothetical protein